MLTQSSKNDTTLVLEGKHLIAFVVEFEQAPQPANVQS